MNRYRRKSRSAFTLLEVLLVVLILGILAAVVIVLIDDVQDSTRQGAFIASLKIISNQAYVYYVETGEYLEDSSSGQLPRGFGDYISRAEWESPTPIGGVWDAENAGDFPGVVSAVGVHFNGSDAKDDVFMAEIDAIMDDGNLSTGSFRKIGGGRFYYLVAAE